MDFFYVAAATLSRHAFSLLYTAPLHPKEAGLLPNAVYGVGRYFFLAALTNAENSLLWMGLCLCRCSGCHWTATQKG